jgi:arabinan endo-1,5-alpha-L-arabinosidase
VSDRPPHPELRPLLTQNLTPLMAYGYGDPAVTRVVDPSGHSRWWLFVTSNDAPDAFPILSSGDLETWQAEGFVFPGGRTPGWAMTGPGSDFWAPEMHQVGDEFWLCFAARDLAGELAIGLARASSPDGPFEADPAPLLGGGVIDPHIVIDPEGAPYLVWKEDTNDRWPLRLAAMLDLQPALAERLFDDPIDRRTAELCRRLIHLARPASPMETFFILQPLIDAAIEDFPRFRSRLKHLGEDEVLPDGVRALAQDALTATRTAIRAQPIRPDGTALFGEPRTILENDLEWEAHLVEGPWISRIHDRYVMFYAANDFSTDRYGVGVATAAHPLGPYHKAPEPLLQSTSAWSAPGHPSVATDPDGRAWLFLHAFHPGRIGYKAFRSLLTALITFKDGQVRLVDPAASSRGEGDAPDPQL